MYIEGTIGVTMAERGDAYMTMFKAAHKRPIESIRASPFKANLVTKMAAATKPTSNIPIRIPVLTCKIKI